MDSSLFGLFALHNTFDKYLLPPKEALVETSLMVHSLRTDIVNELRTRFFVSSSSVLHWRRMIASKFSGNDLSEGGFERDVEEVLCYLLFFTNNTSLFNFCSSYLTCLLYLQ